MLIDLSKKLRNNPIVTGKRFSRGSNISLEGFCSPYKFTSHPMCMCMEKFRYTKTEVGNFCLDCKEEIIINKGMGKFKVEGLLILNYSLFNMINKRSQLFKNRVKIDEYGNVLETDDKAFSFDEMNQFETKEEMVKYIIDKVNTISSNSKDDIIKLIIKTAEDNIEAIFTDVVPVINLSYRMNDFNHISEINKFYYALGRQIDVLNNSVYNNPDVMINGIYSLWGKINDFLDELNLLDSLNPPVAWSARLPVIPNEIDEPQEGIGLFWKAFITIYEYQIYYILQNNFGHSLKSAVEIYDKFDYNDSVLNAVFDIIKEKALVLVNRVPSLTHSSYQGLKINRLLDSSVASMPQVVYSFMAMDNDG